jgi:hypothetical protein
VARLEVCWAGDCDDREEQGGGEPHGD